MKKTYGNLDLKLIRETLNIDFAHFTYPKDMCSCCYGPEDLPKLYRKKGIEANDINSYILFKNSNNGSGTVTKHDNIKNRGYISWKLDPTQLDGVCSMLQEQLGDGYEVVKPESNNECIEILWK